MGRQKKVKFALCLTLSYLIISTFVQIDIVQAQGELWNISVNGTKVVYLKTISDVTGDGYEDVLAITASDSDGWLYIINGQTGAVSTGSTALGYVPTEALFLNAAQRIAVAYSGGVRIYSMTLTQIYSITTANQATDLQTFTGNEIAFYFGSGGTWTITCYSLSSGNQMTGWPNQITSDIFATRVLKDILVINETSMLVLHTYDPAIGSENYHLWLLNTANSNAYDQALSYAITDTLTLGNYNSTYFLNNVSNSTGKYVNLCKASNAYSRIWSQTVWNTNGNFGFSTVDVNADGATDLAVVLGGNLAVLSGKDGTTLQNFASIFAQNITDVAIADDVNSDGVNEVAIHAFQTDQTYLMNLKASSNNIIWQNTYGAFGLESIQDINGDGFKDLVLGNSGNIVCMTGTDIQKVGTPTFSPAAGSFTTVQSITVSSATSGVTIRYTTDGTAPTSSTGTVYSGAISLSSPTTIKAIAYKTGAIDSDIGEATFNIILPTPSPTPTPTSSPSPTPTATATPTNSPTTNPTQTHTNNPTSNPTLRPTNTPTQAPTPSPTVPELPSMLALTALIIALSLASLLLKKQKPSIVPR